jgi:1,2-dihydroxy-3-keto-5-methylthiopentene dioxygenase
MSRLIVYRDQQPEGPLGVFSDPADIGRELKTIGVRFERVDASVELSDGAGPDEVLAAYRAVVDAEMKAHGYTTVDVARIQPDAPDVEAARQKFLSEHSHTEDEARIMVEGSGCFYLHAGDKVFQVECTRGDLIRVPEGMKHWFDMGAKPRFAAIRLFIRPDGWVGHFTGEPIAERFPKYAP